MSDKSTKDLPLSDKQLEEVGQKIVKRGRGRPPGTGGNERPDRQVHTNPGDNTKAINFALELSKLPKVDLNNVEEIQNRITKYFEICSEHDMRPGMASMSLSLGYDRRTVWEHINGKSAKNKEVADTLKKVSQILDSQMEFYMQTGKINPVSGIFLMKNNYGYQDKQEVIVTPQSPLGDTKDTKALEEQYINSTVDDE